MAAIWKKEGLEDDLAEYFRSLMLLVNELIKKYSSSDDYGEYSKRQELWDAIKDSREIAQFMVNDNYGKTLDKYIFNADKY
jgi:hypothetical protein